MKTRISLKECPAFAGLADMELDRIADLGVEAEYNAGSILFREGEEAGELFIIQDGKVAVQMAVPVQGTNAAKKATVDIAQANDLLGWSAVIEPHVHTLTAVCLQKTRSLAISGSRLRSLLQSDNAAGYALLNGMARVISLRLDDTRRLLVSERSWLP